MTAVHCSCSVFYYILLYLRTVYQQQEHKRKRVRNISESEKKTDFNISN